MANGSSSALKILALDPPSSVPPEPHRTALEAEVGQAAAAVATALCLATAEKMDGGGVSSSVRTEGGRRIETLFQLQETHAGEVDFATVVYEQGAKVLRTYIQAEQHSPAAGEFMIGWALDSVVAVLAKVTASARALH